MEFIRNHKIIAYLAEPSGYGSLDNYIPSSEVTLHIDYVNFPFTTSRQNTLFFAHLPEDSDSDPVRKLTFRHVGSNQVPDVSSYSETCNSVEFDGHISSTNAVFGIVSQLPKVESVTVSIGMLQEQYFGDDYPRSFACPSVKSLKVEMDLRFFNGFQDLEYHMSGLQYSLIDLMESLLIQAKDNFKNLENIVLVLPNHEIIREAVRSLVRTSHGLPEWTLRKVPEYLRIGEINKVNEDGSKLEETRFQAGLEIRDWDMMDSSPDFNSLEEEALAIIRGQ